MPNAVRTLATMPLLTAALLSAQTAPTSTPVNNVPGDTASQTLQLEQTDNLHILIRKGFQIKGPGQGVIGEITEPVYHGERQVVAAGTLIEGHIVAVRGEGGKAYANHLLSGDLTPPRYATIAFDQLVLCDGRRMPLQTNDVRGIDGLTMSLWKPKGEKEGLIAQTKTQFHEAIAAPNKMQRLSEALVTSLPYHPSYVDQGTVFNVSVQQATPVFLATGLTPPPRTPVAAPNKPQYMHVRLLTALNSSQSTKQESVEAVVSEPYYNAHHQLLLPAGTHLIGRVNQIKAAGWLRREGALRFEFSPAPLSAGMQHGDPHLMGVEAQKDQFVAVDEEGGLKATAPRLRQITAPLALIGPTTALTDYSKVKTGYQRAGEGRKGFGLLGSGAAQASASTAIGLGYYGAAKRIYSAFIAKGSDIDLPVNTALLVRLDPEAME